MAVPLNRAVFSRADAPVVNRLNAFHTTAYEPTAESTGKLLSNMHRSAPNASILVSIYGLHSLANCAEVNGVGDIYDGNPPNGIPRPPSLTLTFAHLASARMLSRQIGNRSSRLPP